MKYMYLLFVLFFAAVLSLQAEATTVNVSTGKSYANLVWYDLQDDAVKESALNTWDIAILAPGQNASLIINSGAGCKLWEVVGKTVDDYGTPIDTAGLTSDPAKFIEWYNSDDTWAIGAFNCGLNGFEADGDFGWGVYNMSTHAISGVKLFILKDAAGAYHQIRIEDLLSSVFYFSYSDLDGSNNETVEISKKSFPGKTFGYYSIAGKTTVDLDADSWSLLFGKYIAQVDNGQGGTSPYMVNGIRHNYGWTALKVSGQDPATVATPSSEELLPKITTIGHEWKKLNQNFEWEIPTDLCYFVMSEDGLGWKLVFKAFGGSSTGDATFEKSLVDFVSVEDNEGNSIGSFGISPSIINAGESFETAFFSNSDNFVAELVIYDLSGNLVFSQKLDNQKSSLRVSPRLSTGMYFVVLNSGKSSAMQKLIVK